MVLKPNPSVIYNSGIDPIANIIMLFHLFHICIHSGCVALSLSLSVFSLSVPLLPRLSLTDRGTVKSRPDRAR